MYGSIAEADTYFDDDLSGTWDNYLDTQKGKALRQATKQIDRLAYRGEKYDDNQENQFPRILRTGTRTIYFDYDPHTGTVVVPSDVEEATYMQAKYLLDYNAGTDKRGRAIRAGITSISTGGTSESYDKSISPVDIETGIVIEAQALLKKYFLVGW